MIHEQKLLIQPEKKNLQGQVRIRINKNIVTSDKHLRAQRPFHNKQLEITFPAGS